MNGPLSAFFAADHRRLADLLKRATSTSGRIALDPFGGFRAGLLKHIGMEEKILFPTALRAGGDARLFARLRVDHGAIAALLVPTPTPEIVAEILSVLDPHNVREEEPGGAYDICDQSLSDAEAAHLLDELRAFPEIRVKAYNDAPVVRQHIEVNLDLSRRQWMEAE